MFLTIVSPFVLEPHKLQVLAMVLDVLVILHRLWRVSDYISISILCGTLSVGHVTLFNCFVRLLDYSLS